MRSSSELRVIGLPRRPSSSLARQADYPQRAAASILIAAESRRQLYGPDSKSGRGRLGPVRTMRRRPRLLGGKSRRRTPRAMLGTARMHSIVRLLAGVEPVLIDRRDEELRPPVQLRPLRSAGGSLPALRLRQHVLLATLPRDGAQAGAASFRSALSGQPPGAPQARAAPEALSPTPPRGDAGE